MTKKELRKIYIEKRNALSEREVLRADDLLLIRFQQLYFESLNVAHSYMAGPGKKEFDTTHILDYLRFQYPELVVAVPRIYPGSFEMEHIVVDDDTVYQPNTWGIPEPIEGTVIEPSAIDLVLVPLLCFDERGYRVGYGKGYYDRFLAQCRPDVVKLGLSYFEPVPVITDAADFDVPLNYCITPENIYEF